MSLNSCNTPFILSALEQFEDVTWVFFNLILENVGTYVFYVFELDEVIFKNDYAVEEIYNYKESAQLFVVILCFYYFIYAYLNVNKLVTVMSSADDLRSKPSLPFFIFSFFGLVVFISGFVVSGWFSDLFFLNFDYATQKVLFDVNGKVEDFQPTSFVKQVWIFPQVAFNISWDENIISFLGALFLLDNVGTEEYILEEEESDFVEDVVAPLFISNLGKDVEENGALFLKVCSVFSFVLINNLMGMLPYSDTGTSSLILTFWVAFAVFVSLLTLMIKKHGISYFFGLFMPSGCPLPLIFVLIPIEFISYSFRLVSLSVRLFANMMAGHTLLKVIVGFSWSMIILGDVFLIANLFPLAILFVLTFLELAVAIIQSYIFTILTCIYLKDIFVAH